MTERVPRGANSGDLFLMFLADALLAPTIADGDALVFDEDTEKFVPSHDRQINLGGLHLSDIPTSTDGLVPGDIWNNSGVLTIVGQAYYVDATSGSDSNDGLSPAGAWQTIAKVNASTFNQGDSILFKRGEVWTGTTLLMPSSGAAGNPIVLADYGTGALPIIDGTGNNRTYDSNAKSYITLQNIHFRAGQTNCLKIEATDITIIGCTIEGDVAQLANGIGLDATSQTVARITIQGCTVFNNKVLSGGGGGITMTTNAQSDVTIEDCTIYSNGTSSSLDHGIYVQACTNAIVRRNIIYSNAGFGVHLKGPLSNVLVEGNAIYQNHHGIVFAGTISEGSGVTVQNNLIYSNLSNGIYITDATVAQANIYHNSIANNGTHDEAYGINLLFNGIRGCHIKNNLFYVYMPAVFSNQCVPIRVGHADLLLAASGNVFDYNLFWFTRDQAVGPRVGNVAGATKTLATWQAMTGSPDAHSQFAYPLFIGNAATAVDADSNSGQKVLNVAATTGFSAGQIVEVNGGGARRELLTIDTIQAGVSLTMTGNLAYTHTAAQADAVTTNLITDLHIQSASPAKNAGVTGLGVTEDYDQVTRDANPDQGAYEFV